MNEVFGAKMHAAVAQRIRRCPIESRSDCCAQADPPNIKCLEFDPYSSWRDTCESSLKMRLLLAKGGMRFSEQQCSPIEPHENALQIPRIVQERGQSTLQPQMRSHTRANRFYAMLLDRPDISIFSYFTEVVRKMRREVTRKSVLLS